MKYEFHVGDYVETKTGTIGFVSAIPSDMPNDKFTYWTPTKLSNTDIKEDTYIVGDSYYIGFHLENYFNRIGQYDFTKKKQIEFLAMSDNFLTFKNINKDNINLSHFKNKINELVEAVNRLEEKVDG